MKASNYARIAALAMGMAAAMGIKQMPRMFAQRQDRSIKPAKRRRSGTKRARAAYRGQLTMRHLDGVIAATIREAQRKQRSSFKL